MYTCETRKRTAPPSNKKIVCNRRPQNRNWKKNTSKIHVGWSDRCRWELRKRSNDDEKYIAHMKREIGTGTVGKIERERKQERKAIERNLT